MIKILIMYLHIAISPSWASLPFHPIPASPGVILKDYTRRGFNSLIPNIMCIIYLTLSPSVPHSFLPASQNRALIIILFWVSFLNVNDNSLSEWSS